MPLDISQYKNLYCVWYLPQLPQNKYLNQNTFQDDITC